MIGQLDFRLAVAADLPAIESLYPRAFPDEDLLPLVRELAMVENDVLAIVACVEGRIVAHAVLTMCEVDQSVVALLGPVAVDPDHQRKGIGSAIIRDGLRRLADTNVVLVCVLGDPAYYGRLGFETESGVQPPYPLPAEWAAAWQSQPTATASSAPSGTLRVPPPWQHRALWSD